MGIGAQETLLILLIVLVLFGAPVLTFIFGYMLGRRKGADPVAHAAPSQAPTPPKDTPDE